MIVSVNDDLDAPVVEKFSSGVRWVTVPQFDLDRIVWLLNHPAALDVMDGWELSTWKERQT